MDPLGVRFFIDAALQRVAPPRCPSSIYRQSGFARHPGKRIRTLPSRPTPYRPPTSRPCRSAARHPAPTSYLPSHAEFVCHPAPRRTDRPRPAPAAQPLATCCPHLTCHPTQNSSVPPTVRQNRPRPSLSYAAPHCRPLLAPCPVASTEPFCPTHRTPLRPASHARVCFAVAAPAAPATSRPPRYFAPVVRSVLPFRPCRLTKLLSHGPRRPRFRPPAPRRLPPALRQNSLPSPNLSAAPAAPHLAARAPLATCASPGTKRLFAF